MSVQLILKEGQPEYAVLPYDVYLRLVEDAEMLADVRDYDAAMERIAAGEELVPAEVVYALLDGGNPIRIWREHRGMSQSEMCIRDRCRRCCRSRAPRHRSRCPGACSGRR